MKKYWVFITTGALVEAEDEEDAIDVFDNSIDVTGLDWDYDVEEA